MCNGEDPSRLDPTSYDIALGFLADLRDFALIVIILFTVYRTAVLLHDNPPLVPALITVVMLVSMRIKP